MLHCLIFAGNWFDKLLFFKFENSHPAVFIAKQRLYDSFVWWRKNTGQSINVKISTFTDDLSELGITKCRKTVGNHKLSGYIFCEPYVRRGLKAFYTLDTIKLCWCFSETAEFDLYSKKTWRFRENPQGFI